MRIQAKYDRSLEVLKRLSDAAFEARVASCSARETYDEVVETMEDLRAVGCQVVTLGCICSQRWHLPVPNCAPDTFAKSKLWVKNGVPPRREASFAPPTTRRSTFSEPARPSYTRFVALLGRLGCLLPWEPTFWAMREFFCCFHHSNRLKD